MSTNKEVVLNTVVVQDDEEEELLNGPSAHSGTDTPSSKPNVAPVRSPKGGDCGNDNSEDEFELDITYVPRSKRANPKETTGFFSSSSSRNAAAASSATHHKPTGAPPNDGTIALDANPAGLLDDTDKPKDVEEWKRWQERQRARSQLPQFSAFQ